MKTPKMIGLLAVPVVLAAAVVSATGAFAKAPVHTSAAVTKVAPATVPAAPGLDVARATSSQPAAEPATESATEAASTETDAADGHADNPNDPNADHQFDGQE